MEITFFEDPACSWCWAFQPVSTAFAYEFGHALKPRHVMGGLRDRPAADVGFVMGQWKKAETVSGMPFDCRVWKKHVLKTTFVACRAVKAAGMVSDLAAHRMLRRLREALFVEQTPTDILENVLRLGAELGLDPETLKENIASGRAEALFARDRVEAVQYGFGFPTVVLRNGRHEAPVVLHGAVPYSDLLAALSSIGVSPKLRQRFRDTKEHWSRLFAVHPRLTLAEIHEVTQIERSKLPAELAELGISQRGVFWESHEWRHPVPPAPLDNPPAGTPDASQTTAEVSDRRRGGRASGPAEEGTAAPESYAGAAGVSAAGPEPT